MVNATLPFVIGAGLGRTGTFSLYTALNDLGYKSFHMKTIMNGDFDPNIWFDFAKAKRNKDSNADELAMLTVKRIRDEGFNATTDLPVSLLYRELMDIEPTAKVILSIRSSGEVWADSVLETIGKIGPTLCKQIPFRFVPFFSQFSEHLEIMFWEYLGMGEFGEMDCTKPKDRDALIKAYYDWIELVKSTVPKEKLLIHKSADGYGPICKHLGIKAKDCPTEYPNVNDKEEFKGILRNMKRATYICWAFIIIVAYNMIYFIRRTKKSEKVE